MEKEYIDQSNLYTIGLEIGGTNIKVIIINSTYLTNSNLNKINLTNEDYSKIFYFKTSDNPNETIEKIMNKIVEEIKYSNLIQNIGISSFGPLGISKNKENYGYILNTPKIGWSLFDIVGLISKSLNINKNIIKIETDVNSAALLEFKFGNHFNINENSRIQSLAYITIGTGCGIGIIADGRLIHGLLHPEGGHIRVKKHKFDNFDGVCIYHQDCAEGLITNVSIKERKSLKTVDEVEGLDDNDEIWDFFSYYVAQICLNLVYLVSVEKIIIGGGIINRESLLSKIRKYFITLNNNYINMPQLSENIDDYIVRTDFKNNSGILSSLSLALDN